jgi:hypothetical protein
MSYDRMHRWFRRIALGLAFAPVMFAGRTPVAVAKVAEGSTDSHQMEVIPYLSHGSLTHADARGAAATESHQPRVNPHISLWMAHGNSALQQGQQTPYMSLRLDTYGDSRELPEPFVDRPDEVADHVSQSDVAPRVVPSNGDNWHLEWTDALPLGIGIIVLAVGLGLALGRLRRPRLAGL